MNYHRTICRFVIVCLAALPLKTQAQQLITNNTYPVLSVISDFLGQDYQVSNVVYTGSGLAVGQFIGDDCNVGLSNGIILTTGTVLSGENGPHGPNDEAASSLDNSFPGMNFLSAMIGGIATQNAAVLEFDFVPMVDTIGFNYVFGSEEYPEYVGSSFNDVFGFFISGPGITGSENMAILSDSSAVSINTVNDGINSTFFVDNGNGSQAPSNSSAFYIQYDGFTTGLTAHKTGLQIGETYHLVIAIADGGDAFFDSGLFVESCSTCTFDVGLNNTELSEFSLFPNPMSDGATLQIPESVSGKLSVYQVSGKLMQEIETNESQDFIEITGLDNGVYFLSFRNTNGELLFSRRLQVIN